MRPPYWRKPPYSFQAMSTVVQLPSRAKRFDRIISGYRLTDTALLGDPYCMLACRPSRAERIDRLISGYRLTHTALLGDPYCMFACRLDVLYRAKLSTQDCCMLTSCLHGALYLALTIQHRKEPVGAQGQDPGGGQGGCAEGHRRREGGAGVGRRRGHQGEGAGAAGENYETMTWWKGNMFRRRQAIRAEFSNLRRRHAKYGLLFFCSFSCRHLLHDRDNVTLFGQNLR